MNKKYDYDYFVIGAGSGGVRSSRIAAAHGAKVGIAEGRFMGGTCVNVGCVPKKLMAYAADYHAHFEDAVGYGWSAEKHRFDWSKFVERKNAEIERLNGIYETLLKGRNVTVFDGYASFIDAHTIDVNGEKITAKNILIATGGKPRKAEFGGADHMIVSDDAFYLNRLPEHIVIYGGGYIAVEFAHIFSGMGAKVTLVYRGDLFMRGFDADIRCHLRDEMVKQAIDLRFNASIEKITKQSNRQIIYLTNGETVECDVSMAAIGRVPDIQRLNLDVTGVALTKHGHIAVNDRYQTSIPHIHAVGDVTGRVELTPVAIAEGHWLADTLFGGITRPAPSYDNIPTAVFSRPNIGTVGLTEEDARATGYEITVYKTDFKPMVNTLGGRDERSFMKLIIDKKTDKVIGLHMIGLDSAEMLQGFAVAMKAGATKADFDATIGIHPTSAEELVTMRTASA